MVVEISLVVIAVCFLLITIALLPVLIAIRRTFVETHKLVEQVRFQTSPLVHDATQIAGDIRTIVKTLERELPKVQEGFEAVRGAALDIRAFETMLRERVERPMLELTSIVAGVARGITMFWRSLVHRR